MPSTMGVVPFIVDRATPKKTERTHEENQERAYIAASRRADRSIEARVQSARMASEIHRKRTGKGFRITEEIVRREEMYEEEEDERPRFLSTYYPNAGAAPVTMGPFIPHRASAAGLDDWSSNPINKLFDELFPNAGTQAMLLSQQMHGPPTHPAQPQVVGVAAPQPHVARSRPLSEPSSQAVAPIHETQPTSPTHHQIPQQMYAHHERSQSLPFPPPGPPSAAAYSTHVSPNVQFTTSSPNPALVADMQSPGDLSDVAEGSMALSPELYSLGHYSFAQSIDEQSHGLPDTTFMDSENAYIPPPFNGYHFDANVPNSFGIHGEGASDLWETYIQFDSEALDGVKS